MPCLRGPCHVATILGLGLVVAASSGCNRPTRLNAGGSTFVYPIMTKWADEYRKATGVEINYQSIGSGGGIQQMTVRTFAFGCTDGPMNEEQLAKCRASGREPLHIPLVMGAVVAAYNLDEIDEPLRFSGPVLADIYLGHITKWNDARIKDLNPRVADRLPDKEIVVVYRSDGSGTTYVWVDYLAKISPEWKQRVGVGTSVKWPVGIGQKGNEGVAGQVRRSPGSLGYIELIYATQNNMKYGHIRNRAGNFIEPSLKTVTAAADNSIANIPDDLRYSITDAPGPDSYPISGTVWAVVYDRLPPRKGQAVVDFLRWILHDGQDYAEGLHYARLPPTLVERAEKKVDQIKVGQ